MRICLAIFLASALLCASEEKINTHDTVKFPLGADIYMSHNLGAGTFFKAYKQDPSFTSYLYLYPYIKTPNFAYDRQIRLQTEFSILASWLDGKSKPNFTDKFALGDGKIRIELLNALKSNNIGFVLSPGLKFEFPLSKISQDAHKLVGLGAYVNLNWSLWGFFIKYKPLVIAYGYDLPYKTISCDQNNTPLPKLANGRCQSLEQQTIVLLKNNLFTGYTKGNHTLTAGFKAFHSYLRPLDDHHNNSSDILESSVLVLEYSYNWISKFPSLISIGISSLQNNYDITKDFRMPFLNFTEAHKNITEGYLALNISI